MYLNVDQKRKLFNSFSELEEIPISRGRFNYKFDASKSRVKNVICELDQTGRVYVYAKHLKEISKEELTKKGHLNITNFNEENLKTIVRNSIDSLKYT